MSPSQILPATVAAILHPEFDVSDAQAVLSLVDIAALQINIGRRLGPVVGSCLQDVVFPSFGLSPELAQEYVSTLSQCEKKRQLVRYLQDFLLRVRSAY